MNIVKGRLRKKGFTLIEVVVVMAIMAILIALSTSAYNSVRKSSRDGKRKADLEQIRSALEMYRTDCRRYPGGFGTTLVGNVVDCGGTAMVYMSAVPNDPVAGRWYYYGTTSANTYVLCAALELGGGSGNDCGGGSSGCGSSITCNYRTTNP